MNSDQNSTVRVVNTESTEASYKRFADDVINKTITYDSETDSFKKGNKEFDYEEYDFFSTYVSGFGVVNINSSQRFFRAIGYLPEANSTEYFKPKGRYKKDESYTKCGGGRFNPEGIAYLYISSSKEIAQLEVRSKYITIPICEIITKRDLNLVSIYNPKPWIVGKNNFKKQIDILASMPVEESDDKTEYIITQIIARYIKTRYVDKSSQQGTIENQHIDGIKYSSSFLKTEEGQEKYNIVLFDIESVTYPKYYTMPRIDCYNIETSYCQGNKIIFDHKIFESKQDININHIPTGDNPDEWWKLI